MMRIMVAASRLNDRREKYPAIEICMNSVEKQLGVCIVETPGASPIVGNMNKLRELPESFKY